jgi:hypothetical protein
MPNPTQRIDMCNERGTRGKIKRRKPIQPGTMINSSKRNNNVWILLLSNDYIIRRKLYCFPITRMTDLIHREICRDVRNKKNIIDVPIMKLHIA